MLDREKNSPTSTDPDSILSPKRKRARRAENEDKAPWRIEMHIL